MIKAILFDLGGTLFEQPTMSVREGFRLGGPGAYQLMHSRGYKVRSTEWMWKTAFRRIALGFVWSLFNGREFNCYDLQVRQFASCGMQVDNATLRDVCCAWYEPIAERTGVADDVIPTLRKLRDRNLKLVLVSNTCVPGFVLDKHLERVNLLEFFPHRIYSSEIGYRKPHPAPFEAALAAAGVSAAEALFVGDTVRTDIVGARRMGMPTVLRHTKKGSPSHLADFVISRISEIPALLPAVTSAAPEMPEQVDELAYEG